MSTLGLDTPTVGRTPQQTKIMEELFTGFVSKVATFERLGQRIAGGLTRTG